MSDIPETYAQFGEQAGRILWGLHQQITRLEKARDDLRAEVELLKHANLELRAQCDGGSNGNHRR